MIGGLRLCLVPSDDKSRSPILYSGAVAQPTERSACDFAVRLFLQGVTSSSLSTKRPHSLTSLVATLKALTCPTVNPAACTEEAFVGGSTDLIPWPLQRESGTTSRLGAT